MITFTCDVCGTEKSIPAAWYRKHARHTCSRQCAARLPKTPPRARPEARRFATASCSHCGSLIERTRTEIRDGRNFCNAECTRAFWRGRQRGARIPIEARLGATYEKDGYIYEFVGDGRSRNGYLLQHRLVMERLLGRRLHRFELVHHINQVKSDNRPENLQLTTHDEHAAIHKALRG